MAQAGSDVYSAVSAVRSPTRQQTSGGAASRSVATSAPPALTFQDALMQYQSSNKAGKEGYEGLFPYLQGLGFQVERPTRAGGQLSDDKIVNSATGELYDIVLDVGGPNEGWAANNIGWWYDGKPQPNAPRGQGGAVNAGGRTPSADAVFTGDKAVARNAPPDWGYSYALQAAKRARTQASGMGRSSTIGAGFGTGSPSVATRGLSG